MDYIYNDKKFDNIIKDVMNDIDFKEIDTCVHHGISRLEHSLRVSYYSYKVTKVLGLDYKETAVAGLLHDFFLSKNLNIPDKLTSMFEHPVKALENAESHFYLSDMQKDIIVSHMFPLIPNKPPKFLESWVVSLVDKCVATYEFGFSISRRFKFKFENAMIFALFFLNRF